MTRPSQRPMGTLRHVWLGLGTAAQLLRGVARGRSWWLVPIVLFLLPIACLLALLKTVPLVAPFVYTLF